jgi:hypothetical protein
MPPLSSRQFWKANPNQMALPGLEEHSHPGARVLAQGFRFEHHDEDVGASSGQDAHSHSLLVVPHTDATQRLVHGLDAHHYGLPYSENPKAAANLMWASGRDSPRNGLSSGEIGMVETAPGHTRKGLATSLYGVGRTMARIKPKHSVVRTREGDKWARTTTAKYGGRVPKKNLQEEKYNRSQTPWS